MSKQIKIEFILDIDDTPMTPNILTPILTNFFNAQGWEYKGKIENLQLCENEINAVEINYGKK